MRDNGIAVDVIQVASICDAVDVIHALAERDAESPDSEYPSSSIQNLYCSEAQKVIDVLSHVPQLRNPFTLENCAGLLSQSDDGLG
jgi:hypothetical protein